jgi:hypothetical protein
MDRAVAARATAADTHSAALDVFVISASFA